MRIIAVNRYYRPDHSATSQILTDLAEHLARAGDEVLVVTSRLAYEGGAISSARETLAGVNVRRVWSTRFGRAGLAGRMSDYLTFYVSAFLTLLTVGRRGDTVIALTDPPLLSVAAAAAAQIRGFELINWCQDLFPEVAEALGMRWASGPAGRLLTALRNASLRTARFNVALHERMAERLRALGMPSARIRVLPNWADADIRPVPPEDNSLRREWGLQGRYVVGYSGNLGRGHLPPLVTRLVAETRDIEGLAWLFIGGGAGLEEVRRAVDGASNVIFKRYQPRERLSESLSLPDAHLISLEPACEGYMVPSKLYGVRSAGRPVLFLGAADGAVARDMAAHGVGTVLDPACPQAWRGLIEAMVLVGRSETAPAWREGWSAAQALTEWRRQLQPCKADALAIDGAAGPQGNEFERGSC